MDIDQILPGTSRLPKAVLWDMDGTLIDSECYWIAACRLLIEHHGGRLPLQDEVEFVGASMDQTAELVVARGVDLPISEVIEIISASVRRFMVEQGAPLLPGVEHLLRSLATANIPTALVTMSYAENAQVLLEAMRKAGLPTFDVIIAGDQVSRGKPDPECYLLAAHQLNLEPADCLAFEDSFPGGTAAVAAGVPTVLVSDQVVVPGSVNRATLANLDLLQLADLWQSAVVGAPCV
jgi:HAD superfamily hydrolase (TIGR01509 family)